MDAPLLNCQGERIGQVELDESLWGVPFNQAVVHQALVRQLANARQGTASTKTRGEVSGGGIKPRPQKGSGHSRQGSTRAPHWRHGGVVFGPHPRDYRQDMPKKMRRLALRCLLSTKVREGRLVLVDSFALTEPNTKGMARILANLGVDRPALIATRDPVPPVILSARNLPGVKTLPAAYLNVGDLLRYDYLVMTQEAVRRAEEVWARTRATV